MAKEISSEEKLLKLIRKKDRKDDPGKTSDPKNEKDDLENPEPKVDVLKYTNFGLMVIVILFMILLLTKYLRSTREGFSVAFPDDSAARQQPRIELPEKRPFDAYELKLNERNIFEPLVKRRSARLTPPKPGNDDGKNAQPQPAKPKDYTKELQQKLVLVGIVIDRDRSAIVEDKVAQETFFLNEGAEIQEAVLKEIHENKVVFTFKGQDVELSY